MHIALPLLMTIVVGLQGAPPGFRWWLAPGIRGELALTGGQVAAIDAAYDRTLERRKRLRRAFDAANHELTHALARGDLSDSAAEALVGRVEDLRRQGNVARMQLLVVIYFLLTPAQRAELRAAVERARGGSLTPC